MAIVRRQLHRETECHAAWDDRDLMHRIGVRQLGGHQRVSGLVVGGIPLLVIGEKE